MKKERDPNPLDKKPIAEIERIIESHKESSRQAQLKMYESLEYLRTTSRYKENKAYTKSTFWTYIEDRYNIRPTTYRESVKAYLKYPDEAVHYGVGLVSKVLRQCGPLKAKSVFDQLTAQNTMKRPEIEKIIAKNTSPSKIEKTYVDWRAMYEAEKAAHETTRAELNFAQKKINELTAQVRKMKPIVKRYHEQQQDVKPYIPVGERREASLPA